MDSFGAAKRLEWAEEKAPFEAKLGKLSKAATFSAVLFICCPTAASASEVVISGEECFGGKLYNVSSLRAFVFEASKVPELIRLAGDFQRSFSPTDPAAMDRMFAMKNRVSQQIGRTPALARTKGSGTSKVSIPAGKRVIIFGFSSSEGTEEGFAQHEMTIQRGLNRVVLDFSHEPCGH